MPVSAAVIDVLEAAAKELERLAQGLRAVSSKGAGDEGAHLDVQQLAEHLRSAADSLDAGAAHPEGVQSEHYSAMADEFENIARILRSKA